MNTVLLFCLFLDLPSVPGPVVPIRNTDTSVVVCWGASKEVKNLVGYYIEVSVNGSGVWVPCNNKPVKGTRYANQGLTRSSEIENFYKFALLLKLEKFFK